MASIIIGIDGGLDGGIVGLDAEGKIVLKEIMPTIGMKGKGKRTYDIPSMVAILRGLEGVHVWLERAQAMPGQGVSSMFSIGFGFGIWGGIMTALGVPFTIVGPRVWQGEMLLDVDRSDTKRASALIANRLQPTADWRASDRARTPHSGLTDAFCIAEYGRRQENRLA